MTLNEDEQAVFLHLDEQRLPLTSGGAPIDYKQVRASILRCVILQQPLRLTPGAEPKVIEIPKAGLNLQCLEIVGDKHTTEPYDRSAALRLEDACSSEGHPLPPLSLRKCKFHQTIYMSGAKFRNLDLKGSRLTRLKATNLRVEGNLNLSGISSSQERPGLIPVDDDENNPITGAQRLSEDTPVIEKGDYLRECLPSEVIRPLTPKERDAFNRTREDQYEPLCWIELRNAWVGVDVDVSGSTLVCPAAKIELINSPHARYALDLRGSMINGRLTWSPDFRNPPGEVKQFTALGGVSIVRSRVSGSVCGSGGILTAVEGCAFSAQRAEIRGHLFLDFSWEGVREWHRFEAEGFVDLTSASIGSALYMAGAKLCKDRFQRSGLVASQVTIGGNCELRGIERMGSLAAGEKKLVPFQSAGVRLDDATVRGWLDMNGADLSPDSFGHAIYASGMTVNGIAELSVLECTTGDTEILRFTTLGRMEMVGATFKKTLSFSGAKLRLDPKHKRDPAKECALQADLAHIQSTLYFDHFKRLESPEEEPVRTEITGAVSIRRAFIGMNLRMSGLFLSVQDASGTNDPYNRGTALSLSDTRLQGILHMNAFKPDKQSRDPDSLLFDVIGSIDLQQTSVGAEVFLEGARIRAFPGRWAIGATGISVVSRFGAFRNSGTLDVQGGIDLTRSNIPGGLFFSDSTIRAFDPSSTGGSRKLTSLKATMANINSIEINDTTFVGQILLSNLTASYGIKTCRMTIDRGALDLWKADLGYLDLTELHMINPDPVIFDLQGHEQDVDALHLRQAKVAGKFTIRGKLLEPAVPAQADSPAIAARYGGAFTSTVRFTANLRELEVGGLEDADGEGWGDLGLKLEGFICQRPPTRETRQDTPHRRGKSGRLYEYMEASNGLNLLFSLDPLFRLLLRVLIWFLRHVYWHFHMADAHVRWLDRQYWTKEKDSRQKEFTPSAYDQLAKVLREDGHDRESKRILSAKFTVKREVDVALISKPFWWFYHRGFDYGLSSLAAGSTLLLCLLIGCSIFIGLNGASTPLLVKLHEPRAQSGAVAVDVAERCGKPIDASLYAMEVFVPAIKFGDTKTCGITTDDKNHPYSQYLRFGQFLYVIFGWIVVSITLLTIPGILRNRADG